MGTQKVFAFVKRDVQKTINAHAGRNPRTSNACCMKAEEK